MRTKESHHATVATERGGLCELSECYAWAVGPRGDGLIACVSHGGKCSTPRGTEPDDAPAITDADLAEVESIVAFRESHPVTGSRLDALLPRLTADLRRTRAERDEARASVETYQRDAENALKIAAEESDAHDHDNAIIMHNTRVFLQRLRQTHRERSRLHILLCGQIQDDLDRARAINTQAEAVMRQNAEMLAAMERSSDPTMRQLATEIRRRT